MAQPFPSIYDHREMFPLPRENVREFDNYVLSYDWRLRCSRWVFEWLTPGYLVWKKGTRDECYKDDCHESIPVIFRPQLRDYENTRYRLDRGHMAAAANHCWTQEFMDQTFMSTNICPQ